MSSGVEYAVHRLTSDVHRTFKESHIRTLIGASYDNSVSMTELFEAFGSRLRDDRWVVVFKSLSLLHLLIREGNSDRILGYLCSNTGIIYQSMFRSHAPIATKLIKSYSAYLEERASCFRTVKSDWIKEKQETVNEFKNLEDEQQLVKKTEVLQKQISAALGCCWEINTIVDIVVQQGFRFLLGEFLDLFLLSNESIIRVLTLYFQMDRSTAGRALELYKTFVVQTKKFQDIFKLAKESLPMRVELPVFKVPSMALAEKLESYLNAPEFEYERERYRSARMGRAAGGAESPSAMSPSIMSPQMTSPSLQTHFQTTSPSINRQIQAKEVPLIDFFASMEPEQSPGLNQQQQQFNNGWDGGQQYAYGYGGQNGQNQNQNQTNWNYGGNGNYSGNGGMLYPQHTGQSQASSMSFNTANGPGNSMMFPQHTGQSFSANPFMDVQVGIGGSNNNTHNPFMMNASPHNPFASATTADTTPSMSTFSVATGSSISSLPSNILGNQFGQPNQFKQSFTASHASASGQFGANFGGLRAAPIPQTIHNPAAFAVDFGSISEEAGGEISGGNAMMSGQMTNNGFQQNPQGLGGTGFQQNPYAANSNFNSNGVAQSTDFAFPQSTQSMGGFQRAAGSATANGGLQSLQFSAAPSTLQNNPFAMQRAAGTSSGVDLNQTTGNTMAMQQGSIMSQFHAPNTMQASGGSGNFYNTASASNTGANQAFSGLNPFPNQQATGQPIQPQQTGQTQHSQNNNPFLL